jgi:valyl-tRNA synthetase
VYSDFISIITKINIGNSIVEVFGIKGKLNNERFVAGAPEELVSQEREKLAEAEARLLQL